MVSNEISPIAHAYHVILKSFQDIQSPPYFKECLTKQIFYDLFYIRQCQWEHQAKYCRGKNTNISELFQDVIAHYLKFTLGERFIVHVECRREKHNKEDQNMQVYILVKNSKGMNVAAIEVKINLGWARHEIKEKMGMRRKQLARAYNVSEENVFYILESACNVNRKFNDTFIKKLDYEHRNYIFPLFKYDTNRIIQNLIKGNEKQFKDFSDQIERSYAENKFDDDVFDTIIKKIQRAKPVV